MIALLVLGKFLTVGPPIAIGGILVAQEALRTPVPTGVTSSAAQSLEQIDANTQAIEKNTAKPS